MISEAEARFIASEWHGGQNSSLYAFCSSGYVDDFIEIEIENLLSQVKDLRHEKELEDLLEFVKFERDYEIGESKGR